MKNIKNTRAVTYRRYGIPAIIIEGKWLTEKYRLLIGDVVDIDYQPKSITFRKNIQLSKENQKFLFEKKELKRKRIYGLTEKNDYTNTNEGSGQGIIEPSQS